MNDLIEAIIALEWNEFQKVNNEGGRAACQDNWTSFRRYRRSGFLSWDQATLESYHQDLTRAIEGGWNLLTDKYARMMEHTAPDRYQAIADMLPAITEKKKQLIEEIVRITIKWTEEFAREYPSLSGHGRPIHSSEDSPCNTSFETYARGELSTYSEKTLHLYFKHINKLLEENKSLTKMIMENTVREYGYDSLDQAEHTMISRMERMSSE